MDSTASHSQRPATSAGVGEAGRGLRKKRKDERKTAPRVKSAGSSSHGASRRPPVLLRGENGGEEAIAPSSTSNHTTPTILVKEPSTPQLVFGRPLTAGRLGRRHPFVDIQGIRSLVAGPEGDAHGSGSREPTMEFLRVPSPSRPRRSRSRGSRSRSRSSTSRPGSRAATTQLNGVGRGGETSGGSPSPPGMNRKRPCASRKSALGAAAAYGDTSDLKHFKKVEEDLQMRLREARSKPRPVIFSVESPPVYDATATSSATPSPAKGHARPQEIAPTRGAAPTDGKSLTEKPPLEQRYSQRFRVGNLQTTNEALLQFLTSGRVDNRTESEEEEEAEGRKREQLMFEVYQPRKDLEQAIPIYSSREASPKAAMRLRLSQHREKEAFRELASQKRMARKDLERKFLEDDLSWAVSSPAKFGEGAPRPHTVEGVNHSSQGLHRGGEEGRFAGRLQKADGTILGRIASKEGRPRSTPAGQSRPKSSPISSGTTIMPRHSGKLSRLRAEPQQGHPSASASLVDQHRKLIRQNTDRVLAFSTESAGNGLRKITGSGGGASGGNMRGSESSGGARESTVDRGISSTVLPDVKKSRNTSGATTAGSTTHTHTSGSTPPSLPAVHRQDTAAVLSGLRGSVELSVSTQPSGGTTTTTATTTATAEPAERERRPSIVSLSMGLLNSLDTTVTDPSKEEDLRSLDLSERRSLSMSPRRPGSDSKSPVMDTSPQLSAKHGRSGSWNPDLDINALARKALSGTEEAASAQGREQTSTMNTSGTIGNQSARETSGGHAATVEAARSVERKTPSPLREQSKSSIPLEKIGASDSEEGLPEVELPSARGEGHRPPSAMRSSMEWFADDLKAMMEQQEAEERKTADPPKSVAIVQGESGVEAATKTAPGATSTASILVRAHTRGGTEASTNSLSGGGGVHNTRPSLLAEAGDRRSSVSFAQQHDDRTETTNKTAAVKREKRAPSPPKTLAELLKEADRPPTLANIFQGLDFRKRNSKGSLMSLKSDGSELLDPEDGEETPRYLKDLLEAKLLHQSSAYLTSMGSIPRFDFTVDAEDAQSRGAGSKQSSAGSLGKGLPLPKKKSLAASVLAEMLAAVSDVPVCVSFLCF